MERGGSILVARDLPAGPFIGQQVHVQDLLTSAGAGHGCLFLEAILLHDVKCATVKLPG
jgi:hypothetical protein